MSERKPLGSILLESGRITPADVERVLEHQRTHGGYFGQALIDLGIVTADEIDWALASQFDLPFIFPDPAAVDLEAAQLVAADWALAHVAVPMVRAGDTLTVVVADPLRSEVLDELRQRTGLNVEMALASAARIRELIRAIYGGPAAPAQVAETPVALNDVVLQALESGAERIGISARGAAGTAWYVAQGTRHRRALLEGWSTRFEDMLDPSPFEHAERSGGRPVTFEGTLNTGRADLAVEVQVLPGEGGTEFLVRPLRAPAAARAAALVLPHAVAAELRLLARSGGARVGVWSRDPSLAGDVVPHLPALVLQHEVRAAHITQGTAETGVYTIRGQAEPDLIAVVQACDFDSLSTDLPLEPTLAPLLRAAPISFVLVPEADQLSALRAAGINWLLSVSGDQDALAWELRALQR